MQNHIDRNEQIEDGVVLLRKDAVGESVVGIRHVEGLEGSLVGASVDGLLLTAQSHLREDIILFIINRQRYQHKHITSTNQSQCAKVSELLTEHLSLSLVFFTPRIGLICVFPFDFVGLSADHQISSSFAAANSLLPFFS
jgi:hypothetical protein